MVNSDAPLMKDGGSIVSNGSAVSYTGQPEQAVYADSKSALVAMAHFIATDLAPRYSRQRGLSRFDQDANLGPDS